MEIKEYIELVEKTEDVKVLQGELRILHGHMIKGTLDDDIMDRVFIVRDRVNILLEKTL